MSHKIYPIGIQNFEKIRNDGYFYIDKTALMYQMVKTGSYYFLSRPRRFGKSLLVSTLEAYFQGKKELFEGLAVEKLEKDWIKYPILHLDLNIEKYDTSESLDNILDKSLTAWEKLYGAEPSERSFSLRFAGIIERACKLAGQRVVILVDEYDKPMLQAIGNEELQKQFRNTLKPFYGALKTMDGCIKFAFLTGVTKFGKVSVFSDLNNLDDISMWNEYVEICGVSEREIHENLEAERDHRIGIAAGLRGCVSELVEDTENGCAGSDRDALGGAGDGGGHAGRGGWRIPAAGSGRNFVRRDAGGGLFCSGSPEPAGIKRLRR